MGRFYENREKMMNIISVAAFIGVFLGVLLIMCFVLNFIYIHFFYKREAVTDFRNHENDEIAKYVTSIYERVMSENFIRDDSDAFRRQQVY